VLGQLVHFEWEQRAGGDDGEIFGPMLAQQQADPFDSQQGGVKECARAQFLQLLGSYGEELGEKRVNVAAVGIDAQHIHPMSHALGEVFVKKPERADADSDKRDSLEELEEADEDEAGRVLLFPGSFLEW